MREVRRRIFIIREFSFEDARSFSSYMCEEFARGEYDRLGIIYTKYISMMKQEAELSWLLPLERVFRDAGGGKPAEKSEQGVVLSLMRYMF